MSASPRIVNGVRALLREDVYHWHSKVMLKEPRQGGAWEWHQDYGYWYHDGAPYPRLLSCMIALDPATRENGCLKVLVGSHLLGRLDHGRQGSQVGADPERIAARGAAARALHRSAFGQRDLLPLQPAARLRAEPLGPPPARLHLLLQRLLECAGAGSGAWPPGVNSIGLG